MSGLFFAWLRPTDSYRWWNGWRIDMPVDQARTFAARSLSLCLSLEGGCGHAVAISYPVRLQLPVFQPLLMHTNNATHHQIHCLDIGAGGKKGGKGHKSAAGAADEEDSVESLDDIAGIPESKARFEKVLQVCLPFVGGIVGSEESAPGGGRRVLVGG